LGPWWYEHTVYYPVGPPATLTSPTPYTRVPPDRLRWARANVEALYPPTDRAAWQQVCAWGSRLRAAWWEEQFRSLFQIARVATFPGGIPPIRVINADGHTYTERGYQPVRVSSEAARERARIDEEEALWFVWQRLRAGHAHADEE